MGLFTCSFVSYALCRMVEVNVILPTPTPDEAKKRLEAAPGASVYRPEHKYPVMYLLHGYSGNATVWQRFSSLERYAEERSIAVVTLSGENKAYVNRLGDDRFYDFLEKELPDLVSSMFPISTRREDTYIAGLSMGGFGTLLHAMGAPERYCAFGAFSAGMGHSGADLPADAAVTDDGHDLFVMLKGYAGKMDRLPKGYISCGTEDFLYELNVEFKDQYLAQGGALTWEAVPGYGHEWAFWDREVERFLDWIPRTDAYAGAPRRHV